MISFEQRLDLPGAEPEPNFDLEDPYLVAAAWSRLVEPGDTTAGMLASAVGPAVALRWVFAAVGSRNHQGRAVSALCERIGNPDTCAPRLRKALDRWAPRLKDLNPDRDIAHLRALAGTLLIPGTPAWPSGLLDLGDAQPHCLWVRAASGSVPDRPTDPAEQRPEASWIATSLNRSVALVGARACTDYGTAVTHDLSSGLADRNFTVVSGGAYGIDAAAHRGVLAAGGTTFVLLAGGVDRLYPAGNAKLLRAVVDSGGAVLSEVPPGAVPSRSRFLQRNRLIAAMSNATVVVEAAWRSGSLNTATHAQSMLRPVGAVPGPVTSMASAGAHRLLREHGATCVTDAAEVAELAGEVGQDLAPQRHGHRADYDGLTRAARSVYDALPVRSHASPESIARAAGISTAEVLAGLGELELRDLAKRQVGQWQRSRRSPGA